MNFIFYLFFFVSIPRALISRRAVDSHQMYSGGSAVGKCFNDLYRDFAHLSPKFHRECRRGLVMRIVSVCPSIRPSVCLSACMSVKRVDVEKNERKISPDFYTTRNTILSKFSEKKNGWWGRPLLPEFLGQPTPVGTKSPILNRQSLVAPHP